MRFGNLAVAAVSATVLAFAASGAMAAPTVYEGSDDGSAIGAATPNSDATQASFLADAVGYGATYTETFSSIAQGYGPRTLGGGASVTYGASNFGDGFSGISSTTLGNVYGYDIGDGTGNWLGAPAGTVTFTFSDVIYAFGFYATGTQQTFGVGFGVNSLFLTSNVNGGAQYFGFTDAAGFTSVTINSTGSNDAWGIDNITYTETTTVPEPATWAMLILGMGGIGATLRSNRRRMAIA